MAAYHRVAGETDGVMARYRDRHLDSTLIQGEWHEIKLGLVADWQADGLVSASYVAARETATSFAPRLGSEAARRGALNIVGCAGRPPLVAARRLCCAVSWLSVMVPGGSGSTWPPHSAVNASKSWTGITAANTCGGRRGGAWRRHTQDGCLD